jgi:hypothetical protein
VAHYRDRFSKASFATASADMSFAPPTHLASDLVGFLTGAVPFRHFAKPIEHLEQQLDCVREGSPISRPKDT